MKLLSVEMSWNITNDGSCDNSNDNYDNFDGVTSTINEKKISSSSSWEYNIF